MPGNSLATTIIALSIAKRTQGHIYFVAKFTQKPAYGAFHGGFGFLTVFFKEPYTAFNLCNHMVSHKTNIWFHDAHRRDRSFAPFLSAKLFNAMAIAAVAFSLVS